MTRLETPFRQFPTPCCGVFAICYIMLMEKFDRKTTLAYLGQARIDWLRARNSAEREGGRNTILNELQAKHMERLDGLLDELIIIGGFAIDKAS